MGDVAAAAALFRVVLLTIRVQDVGDFLFERDTGSGGRSGGAVLTIFRFFHFLGFLPVLVAVAFLLARLRLFQTVAAAHALLDASASDLNPSIQPNNSNFFSFSKFNPPCGQTKSFGSFRTLTDSGRDRLVRLGTHRCDTGLVFSLVESPSDLST